MVSTKCLKTRTKWNKQWFTTCNTLSQHLPYQTLTRECFIRDIQSTGHKFHIDPQKATRSKTVFSHVDPMKPISSFNLTVSPFLITSGTSSLRTRIHLACTRT